MKHIILLITLSLPAYTQADLFDVDPVSLCNLFKSEGVITSVYGPVSDSNGKLCYTPEDIQAWKKNGYLLRYRVLGYWKWNELTGNVFISITGLESKILADEMLSKYKRMAYVLIDEVTVNTDEKRITDIVNSIVSKRSTYQSVEAMSISSYISREEYGGQASVEYRLDIQNQCMYHPSQPGRNECIAERIKKSNNSIKQGTPQSGAP